MTLFVSLVNVSVTERRVFCSPAKFPSRLSPSLLVLGHMVGEVFPCPSKGRVMIGMEQELKNSFSAAKPSNRSVWHFFFSVKGLKAHGNEGSRSRTILFMVL